MRTRILFDLIARLSLVHVYLSFALYIHPYLYPTPTQKALELIKFYRFSVQSLSCVWLFVTPWTAACQASLSITNSRSLLKFMSIESVMPSNHLILCHPLLFLPSVFLSIRWLKYWSFHFSISPSNEYSELISFRIDWLIWSPCSPRDSQESSPHHSSKTLVLWSSAFFLVQLSHPHMTTRKTIALTRRAFVSR